LLEASACALATARANTAGSFLGARFVVEISTIRATARAASALTHSTTAAAFSSVSFRSDA